MLSIVWLSLIIETWAIIFIFFFYTKIIFIVWNNTVIFWLNIIQVGLSLSKLHFIHTFLFIMMNKSFPSKHSCELFWETSHNRYDSGRVMKCWSKHWKLFILSLRNCTVSNQSSVRYPWSVITFVRFSIVIRSFLSFTHGYIRPTKVNILSKSRTFIWLIITARENILISIKLLIAIIQGH